MTSRGNRGWRAIVALAGSLMFMALPGFAAPLETGTMELGLQGFVNFDNPDGDVDTRVAGSFGYFVMNNIEVGGLASVYSFSGHGSVGAGPFGEMNFDINLPVMPYIACRITYNVGDYRYDNYLLMEGAAGTKCFLTEYLAVALEVVYDIASAKVFNRDGSLQKTDAGLRLGLRTYF